MQNYFDKITISFYTQRFLNFGTTFIYRQLKGAQEYYNPIVLTPNKSAYLDSFPFDEVYAKPKSFFGRAYRLFHKLSGRYAILSAAQLKYFEKILKEKKVRLIHAHFGPSGIEILPLAKKLKIPLLVSFHGYDASAILGNQRYINDLKELFEYSYTIAVSDYMASRLIEIGAKKERMRVLYYGIPLSRGIVSRIPIREKVKFKKTIKFLQISNFDEKKGHIYTVEAFKEFLKYYDNGELILGGDGPTREIVAKRVTELGLDNKVRFLGRILPENVYDIMSEADIFVHHSITSSSGNQEGIPNVIMEAMSTGMFAISTYHAGIPELIDDGVDGFLVNEKDVPGYVQAMLKSIKSDEDMRSNAYNKIHTKFNLIAQNKKLCDIYKGILNDFN